MKNNIVRVKEGLTAFTLFPFTGIQFPTLFVELKETEGLAWETSYECLFLGLGIPQTSFRLRQCSLRTKNSFFLNVNLQAQSSLETLVGMGGNSCLDSIFSGVV